jgi:HlyD family secretion protein
MFFLSIASLVVAGCSGALPGNNGAAQVAPTSTPVPTIAAVAKPTYLVQRGDVQSILDFTGRWQPRDQNSLSFPIAGQIRRVTVKRGDSVKAGQLLADFEITSLENTLANEELTLQTALANLNTSSSGSVNTVADAQVALANANLSLDKTKQGNPWTSVASAKVNVQGAEAGLLSAQRAYFDAISKPNNPPSAIDAAYNGLVNAQNQLKTAQINYDQAAQNYANYQFGILQASNSVIQAQLNLEVARRGGTDPTKQQAVTSAQLAVDQTKAQIAKSSLVAPTDGEILSVTIKPGDQAAAFAVVMTMGRPEPKEVVASIAIGDAQKLSIGMVGVCLVANQPETSVQCAVRRIPLTAQEPDQTTRVAASLENLRTDTIVEVKMPTQISKNVLWLPPAAVRTFQNRTFVQIQTPGGEQTSDVTLGLQTTDRVEIKSGVKEGDVVVGP